ncbi:OmpP1/FadL family transporter [Lacinutrix salivirga]
MKKRYILFVSLFYACLINAQDINDALRYSDDNIQGSARYRALSGAFGALGGDMSAVSQNPASSAVFTNSHFSASLNNVNQKNDTQYFNGFSNSSNSNFDLNQVGAAFVFKNRNESSPWKKLALSIAYDKTKNHENDWFVSGINGSSASPGNSISNYFLANAQGLRLDEISAFEGESVSQAYADIGSSFGYANQQAFLGYNSYIIDPVNNTDENTVYVSNISGDTFNQKFAYVANGYNGKFTFNIASQFKENVYFGLNLNSHFINYERFTSFYESNNNTSSLVNEVEFDNLLSTNGSGFSFQLGTIIKIDNSFRVGLSYDSPTWFTIEEETSQSLSTYSDEGFEVDGETIFGADVNPQIINLFPSYRLQTPGRLTGSLAYIFGDKGLISFDYSRKDYGNTKFKPTSDNYFASQNSIMNNLLTAASTYKIGGEYRVKDLSIRAGYRLEESPYKNGNTVEDLTGFSLGLGYSFGNTKLDLTFDQSQRSSEFQLFNVGLTDSAIIDNKNSNITLSLGFNL